MVIRGTIFSIAMCLIIYIIGLVFWNQELRYKFPTPIPANHQDVPIGSRLDLAAYCPENGKPTLIHFYDDDCTCSKFNLSEIKRIIEDYDDEINVLIVQQSIAGVLLDGYLPEGNIVQVTDELGLISDMCGVYSTPQGVIVDRDYRLLYRGNYSQASFCTKIGVRYIDLALKYILAEQNLPLDVQYGSAIPYGCNLPSDEVFVAQFSSPISLLFEKF